MSSWISSFLSNVNPLFSAHLHAAIEGVQRPDQRRVVNDALQATGPFSQAVAACLEEPMASISIFPLPLVLSISLSQSG